PISQSTVKIAGPEAVLPLDDTVGTVRRAIEIRKVIGDRAVVPAKRPVESAARIGIVAITLRLSPGRIEFHHLNRADVCSIRRAQAMQLAEVQDNLSGRLLPRPLRNIQRIDSH